VKSNEFREIIEKNNLGSFDVNQSQMSAQPRKDSTIDLLVLSNL